MDIEILHIDSWVGVINYGTVSFAVYSSFFSVHLLPLKNSENILFFFPVI